MKHCQNCIVGDLLSGLALWSTLKIRAKTLYSIPLLFTSSLSRFSAFSWQPPTAGKLYKPLLYRGIERLDALMFQHALRFLEVQSINY